MSAETNEERYRRSLTLLIRHLTGIAQSLKQYEAASLTDPRTATLPDVPLFEPTGSREVDAVANTFCVTFDVLRRHVGRLEALTAKAEIAEPTIAEETVLSIGIADRLSALYREGPHRTIEALERLTMLLLEIARRHSGEFHRVGDGSYLVLFHHGPRNREGDESPALRACRCALEVIAALDQFNVRQLRRRLPPVRAAMGIHTGAVICGVISEGDVGRSPVIVGPAVSLAAALGDLAQGEIRPLFVSGFVAEAVRGMLRAEKRECIALRDGEMEQSVWVIVHGPPHADYRDLLDGLFGAETAEPESADRLSDTGSETLGRTP